MTAQIETITYEAVTPEDVVHVILGLMSSDIMGMANRHEFGTGGVIDDWAMYADLAAKKFGIESPDINPWYIYINDQYTKALGEDVPFNALPMTNREYATRKGLDVIGSIGAAIESKYKVKVDYRKIETY